MSSRGHRRHHGLMTYSISLIVGGSAPGRASARKAMQQSPARKARPSAALKKLDAKTRRVFEQYVQDVQQRKSGVIGMQSPDGSCTLYDFVQQRVRPFLTQPQSGCCKEAAVAPTSATGTQGVRGHCLAGARLLISIGSYGNDARGWALLSVVLASLDAARRSANMARMDIVLDITSAPGGQLVVPAGLNVTEALHDRSLRKDLPGQYRPRFARSLERNEYDYYAYFNDDVNVTADALEALCAWQGPLSRTNLMVGMIRWETREDGPSSRRLLNDQALCCPPHLGGVVTIGGRRLMVPTNPHHGGWFLPAARLRCVLRQLAGSQEVGKDWLAPSRIGSLEYYDGLWLMPWLIRVVPLDDYENLLVHHLSDRYARTSRIRMTDVGALRAAADRFSGFEPLTLPGPGTRGRRRR